MYSHLNSGDIFFDNQDKKKINIVHYNILNCLTKHELIKIDLKKSRNNNILNESYSTLRQYQVIVLYNKEKSISIDGYFLANIKDLININQDLNDIPFNKIQKDKHNNFIYEYIRFKFNNKCNMLFAIEYSIKENQYRRGNGYSLKFNTYMVLIPNDNEYFCDNIGNNRNNIFRISEKFEEIYDLCEHKCSEVDKFIKKYNDILSLNLKNILSDKKCYMIYNNIIEQFDKLKQTINPLTIIDNIYVYKNFTISETTYHKFLFVKDNKILEDITVSNFLYKVTNAIYDWNTIGSNQLVNPLNSNDIFENTTVVYKDSVSLRLDFANRKYYYENLNGYWIYNNDYNFVKEVENKLGCFNKLSNAQ